MNDIIKETYIKVKDRPTKINKFYIIKRYLKMKYKLQISKSSLLSRMKQWSKESRV